MRLLHVLDRWLHAFYRACGVLAALFIVLIAGLVLVNIGSRIAGAFVPGLTESAGYCMAAAGALGLTYTFAERGHIRVTMLINRFRGRRRFAFELLTLAISTGLACYLAFYVSRMVWVSYLYEERSDGSDDLLIWIPQLPMAVGFSVFAIALVHAVVKAVAVGELESPAETVPDA